MTGTPRYRDIADYVRGLIETGKPGDRLPSETELCERFGVSRMTVRQAIQLLATEGLLYRRAGQGTFIGSRRVPRPLGSPLSFTENMRQRGLRASSQLLTAAMIAPAPEDVAALQLTADVRHVVLLERLRLADDVPMAIERAILVPDLARVLESDLEGGSLHVAIEQFGRIPTRAEARVSARPSAARERKLLGQGSAGVVLCERRVIVDQHSVPLEHTETCYAAERYDFDAIVERTAPE